MLQEATKALNSAFNNSFIKKLSQYLHDCVREEVKSSTFRNLKGDKENKWIFLKEQETLLTQGLEYLKLDGSNPNLTELMLQGVSSARDKYLIYGYMFLVGKSGKSRKGNEFLTPLLYVPCKLERNGVNINCILQDDVLSLNTGALAALLKKGEDDDEVDLFLEGILDVVPEVPITKEKMDIFLTTLKSLIPDIEISSDPSLNDEEDNVTKDEITSKDLSDTQITGENYDEIIDDEIQEQKQKAAVGDIKKLSVTYQSAIILTKRPAVTAGVLHELLQIAEKPSGVFRETTLSVINDEYTQSGDKIFPLKDGDDNFYPITPLSLSDSQEKVIKNVETAKLVAVQGPPGTGKSQTIVNMVAHLIANGKTVLVASRMDKAVDVVADRLNELGAPYLALRAGRMNYQKQLSEQLNELVKNRDLLDENVDDYIFADVKDMKQHLDVMRETEAKCEKILKYEKEWHDLKDEIKQQSTVVGELQYIKRPLKKSEIDNINDVIKSLSENLEKSGFFASFANMSSQRQLRKILDIKDFEVEPENLDRLKVELDFVTQKWRLRKIETDIQKTGNLHVMMEQIRQMKRKQKTLAVNILKSTRREALKALLRDVKKVGRIKIHARALISRKKKSNDSILESEDFKPLLDAFPCWCVTTYAVSDSLPLKPGMFDVAIIDEASQCDIASCFPIMYRAKKTVVVGDDKQLPHLSFLEKAKEQSFLSQYGIPDKYQLMWRFRTNSMFDLADYYSMNSVMLDEHFRSLPPIIEFSNQEFYNGRIRIMRTDKTSDSAIDIIKVEDGKVDLDATRNLPEIEALVKTLHEIIIEDERKNPDNPVSIGIISPFRAQVEQLKISVPKVLSDYMIKKHQIEIGTAHTFQGDERDIILMSWAFANNSYPQSITFLQKPNLFNVAITRAKNKCINFVSHDLETMPDGHFRHYVSYLKQYKERKIALLNNEIDENIYKNSLEREVAQNLREQGHQVVAGAEIAGLSADLVVDDKFIVEIDGVEDNKKAHISNMKKQAILERCGMKVRRITYREWQYSKQACLDRVLIED
ncbi:MAG: AAA domain-containing protein [Candidatus Gastranaerophilaceae bacterium]